MRKPLQSICSGSASSVARRAPTQRTLRRSVYSVLKLERHGNTQNVVLVAAKDRAVQFVPHLVASRSRLGIPPFILLFLLKLLMQFRIQGVHIAEAVLLLADELALVNLLLDNAPSSLDDFSR